MSRYLLWHIYSFSLIFLPWFFGLIHHHYSGTLWDTHTATSVRPEVIFHMQRVRSVQWNLSYSRLCVSRAIVCTHNIHTYKHGKNNPYPLPRLPQVICNRIMVAFKMTAHFSRENPLQLNPLEFLSPRCILYIRTKYNAPVYITLFTLTLEPRLNYSDFFEFFLHKNTALYF